MRCGTISAVFFSACLLLGCDKNDDSTAPPPQPPLPRADLNLYRPTTQQLLSGPRKALFLELAPITLQVPTGWTLKTGSDTLPFTVEGATPTDDVVIAVSAGHSITAVQEKKLEAAASDDVRRQPDLMKQPDVRDITGGKLIEQLILDPPAAMEPNSATPTTEPIQTMQWIFTICIPADDGNSFTTYDLRFLGMTIKQYKADQAFLRSVIDSLRYTPGTDTMPK